MPSVVRIEDTNSTNEPKKASPQKEEAATETPAEAKKEPGRRRRLRPASDTG